MQVSVRARDVVDDQRTPAIIPLPLRTVLSAVAVIAAFALLESPAKAQTSETCFHSTIGGAPISTPMCFVAEAHFSAKEMIPDVAPEGQNSAGDAVAPPPMHSEPIPPALEPPVSD